MKEHGQANFKRRYENGALRHIAFPIGGMGTGMFTLTGTGSFDNFSLRHKPEMNNEPNMFAALHIKGSDSFRVLEGLVPDFKIFAATGGMTNRHGIGRKGKNYGLPRFRECAFEGRFPFAKITLHDEDIPLEAEITGWSPFSPNDADNASLPFGCIEYTFTNQTRGTQEAVFYFHSVNLAKIDEAACIAPIHNGFSFFQPGRADSPSDMGFVNVFTDEKAYVDTAWYQGAWFDAMSMICRDMKQGIYRDRLLSGSLNGEGASLAVPFALAPGENKTIRIYITWYIPVSDLRCGHEFEDASREGTETLPTYVPWYAKAFDSIEAVDAYVTENVQTLRDEAETFSDCLFSSTLPPEIMDAVSANLSILKSPTILRQADGRLWGWEGCRDNVGSCYGSCTHVWNYAQAICHLFPELERSLRNTEFECSQNGEGHQAFRASLPIGSAAHDGYAAADGQLGGIIKLYRDWRISGDTEWLRSLWPLAKKSIAYCIGKWDPDEQGALTECHHNTYDIEFWGADIMCSSIYLGALLAASKMAEALDDADAAYYLDIYDKGRDFCEKELFNGAFFFQRIATSGLRTNPKPQGDSTEERERFFMEGPKYQYGSGCLSDGLLGAWLSCMANLPDILDERAAANHLLSVHAHNLKKDMFAHINPQRPGYALNEEAGLLLCTWPKGGEPSLPFVYSNEVWTGVEYEVASHLIAMGYPSKGLEIVRSCRGRYTSGKRNPYNEYECGHWYARAMASYALLKAYSGAFYDAVNGTMYLAPKDAGDFSCFLSTDKGYGMVGVKRGKPFYQPVRGSLEIKRWSYVPYQKQITGLEGE